MSLRHLVGTLCAIVVALLPASGGAAPVDLALQGRLSSAAGGAVADGMYGLAVTLYDAQVGGTAVFKELFIEVPVQGGVFGLTLGAADTPLDTAVLVTNKPLWVGVKVAGDPELPRVALRHVPWAVRATVATGLQCSGCVSGEALAVASVTTDKIAPAAVGAAQVSFPWAAADGPGGAATFALAANTAKLADQAKYADSAKQADSAAYADEAAKSNSANTANSAVTAATATVAKALQCTGCVGLGALAAETAAAFVSSKDGSAQGKLSLDGELALGKSAISGGRFAAVDVKTAPCAGDIVGQVALDAASKRLYFCDGAAWRRLSSCTGACKDPSVVACGQPVIDDCGDAGQCQGTGSACASGLSCSGGKCVGPPGTLDNPALHCKDLLTKAPGTKSGVYWVDPDGGGGIAPFQAYCDMLTEGGGWTLVWSNTRGGTGKPGTNMKWTTATTTAPIVKGTIGDNLENFTVYTGLAWWSKLAPGGQWRYQWAPDYGSGVAQARRCSFTLDANAKYKLALSNCVQQAGSVAPGIETYHNGMAFATIDNDTTGCATQYSSTPWWYKDCWSGSIHGGGESNGGGYYNGAYWTDSAQQWGTAGGSGAGNGWMFVR